MKKEIITLILTVSMAAATGYNVGKNTEIVKQEKEATRQQSEAVTLQIYNGEQKTWDTYQGTLVSDRGLYGDWKYEVMGKELILTGARLIGQIPAEEGE